MLSCKDTTPVSQNASPAAYSALPENDKPASFLNFLEVEGSLPQGSFRDGSEQQLFSLIETTGGGCALLDYDRDGQLDIVHAGGGFPDLKLEKLSGYPGNLHRQRNAWKFDNCGSEAHVDFSRTYNAAVIAADYDNDGFTDLLVTGFDALQCFRNQGDGTYEQVRAIEDSLWSSSAAFFDADQDGDLDLYVVHYADWSWTNNPFCPSQTDPNRRDYCGPTDFRGLPDRVYENLGDGTFAQRTPEGLGDEALRGLGVIAADLDGDRDTDLYVTNDVEPNLLYRNDGPFRWTELGRRASVATNDQGRAEGSMGVAIGDYNNDQKFDLWVTNYADEYCALYKGMGRMSFSYATNAARIAVTDERSVGWGTQLADFDLDGDEDIVIINGHLERYAPYHDQRPQLLENIDGKYFVLSALDSKFFQTPQPGRGLATGDMDRDGRIDLVVTRINANFGLIRNESQGQGAYLSVRLVGTQSNRDAIGTVLTLKVGERSWIRQIAGGGSYASTNDLVVHFGIPAEQAHASKQSISQPGTASLRVDWPSGQTTEVAVPKLDTEILIIEGE
ncbi:MAG: VCBS repeat-containing protein [Planctomycetes bacterium]|nr:VCBS repeat-containing protein [Planctomycetota bacterium]